MIRLQRVGRRNDPSYRVVLTDKRNAPQSGKFKEILGSYDPRNDAPQLKSERITHWIEQGAQPSDTVHNLLISQGIIKGTKINVLPKKSPVVDEEAIKKAEEAKKAAEEALKAEAEAPAEEVLVEESVSVEEEASDSAEAKPDMPVEEEKAEEAPAEEEVPAEEEKTEEAPEEKKEESEPEETPEEDQEK